MNGEKISPELNIAIGISESERQRSLDLDVGYSRIFEEWELIVRYTGDLEEIQSALSIEIVELLGGYAILRIPQFLIAELSSYPQIVYIEKPKSLLIEQDNAISKSCVNGVRLPSYSLFGEGVLIACIDSGVDFYHSAFRNADGTTKIAVMWDQTIPGNPPYDYKVGSVFSKEDINQALKENQRNLNSVVTQYDSTGHGTAVMGVMTRVAPDAEYIVVKMGNPIRGGFPRTTQLMLAIDFCVRYAVKDQKPLAINISYGNNYGSHDGNSIIEQYIDVITNLYRNTIVTGTGNDGLSGRHFSTKLLSNQQTIVEIQVANYLSAFNLQLWKEYRDDILISIQSPAGERIGPISESAIVQKNVFMNEEIIIDISEPTPYNSRQEIYMAWIPKNEYITPGIWNIILEAEQVTNGEINMWLPVYGSTSSEVAFLRPSRSDTLVIPSTARSSISVSAYNSINDTLAPFSGAGRAENEIRNSKPDLAAPGVRIQSARVGGGYGYFTGTSFAAPFVTAASALLMQWGIVNGNDPYMFGEKVRANLIRGARRLPFQEQLPSPEVGWGALCVSDSIPKS